MNEHQIDIITVVIPSFSSEFILDLPAVANQLIVDPGTTFTVLHGIASAQATPPSAPMEFEEEEEEEEEDVFQDASPGPSSRPPPDSETEFRIQIDIPGLDDDETIVAEKWETQPLNDRGPGIVVNTLNTAVLNQTHPMQLFPPVFIDWILDDWPEHTIEMKGDPFPALVAAIPDGQFVSDRTSQIDPAFPGNVNVAQLSNDYDAWPTTLRLRIHLAPNTTLAITDLAASRLGFKPGVNNKSKLFEFDNPKSDSWKLIVAPFTVTKQKYLAANSHIFVLVKHYKSRISHDFLIELPLVGTSDAQKIRRINEQLARVNPSLNYQFGVDLVGGSFVLRTGDNIIHVTYQLSANWQRMLRFPQTRLITADNNRGHTKQGYGELQALLHPKPSLVVAPAEIKVEPRQSSELDFLPAKSVFVCLQNVQARDSLLAHRFPTRLLCILSPDPGRKDVLNLNTNSLIPLFQTTISLEEVVPFSYNGQITCVLYNHAIDGTFQRVNYNHNIHLQLFLIYMLV